MTNIEVPPKPQRDVIREVDWLAVAPWTLVLRAPGATIGWPFVIGALGTLALFAWTFRLIQDHDIHETVIAYLAILPSTIAEPWLSRFQDTYYGGFIGYTLRLLGWFVLGTIIVDQSAATLVGASRPGIGRTIRRTWRHSRRALSAVLLLLLGAAPFAIALWVFGLSLSVPGLGTATAPLLTVAGVLLAVPLTLILLVATIGAPLMVSAVVIDDADAFDAVSRTIAYSLQRPLTLFWCVAVAALAGFASGVLLEIVYRVSLGLIQLFLSGSDKANGEQGVHFWSIPFAMVMHGFYPAYTFVAGAAIYLVMRRQVDGQPMDEISHADGVA